MRYANSYKSLSESSTNVFVDGKVCPSSIFDVNMTSTEAVTDMMRDGAVDSCLEPKTLVKNSFRLLVPSPPKLRRIRVLSRGFLSCRLVYGITMYGVVGCFGEDATCELRICTAYVPKKQSDWVVCGFTCSENNYRYAFLDIKHYAIGHKICEIDFY